MVQLGRFLVDLISSLVRTTTVTGEKELKMGAKDEVEGIK